MLCKEIIQVIEASYPKEAALDFDNVGPVSYTHLTLPTSIVV